MATFQLLRLYKYTTLRGSEHTDPRAFDRTSLLSSESGDLVLVVPRDCDAKTSSDLMELSTETRKKG